MVSYHGGKQKIGKEISIILINIMEEMNIHRYIEPFVGMCGVLINVIDKSDNKYQYFANDINSSLIKMWKKLQTKKWIPPIECDQELYDYYKYNSKSSAEKGFICHCCSFGGIYLKGYRGKYGGKKIMDLKNQSNKLINMGKSLHDVKFYNKDYSLFSDIKNSLIYCDPPYSIYNSYYDEKGHKLNFNEKIFWEWCDYMSINNIVIVSEYNAPEYWKVIWKREVNNTNNNGKKNKRYEKLFIHSKYLRY